MKIVSVVGASLVASLLVGCASPAPEVHGVERGAQPRLASERSAPPDLSKVSSEQERVSVERIQQVERFYPAWRASAFTAGFKCMIVNNVCRVTISVFQSVEPSTNIAYCIGLAPEFVVIEGQGRPKRILWELQLIDAKTGSVLNLQSDVKPAGSTLGFLGDSDRGVLVFRNIYDNQHKEQLKEGKRGIDPSNGSDITKFHMKNEHKENGTAAYLPIIVHTDSSSGVEKVALCGTPDPVIYNVQ